MTDAMSPRVANMQRSRRGAHRLRPTAGGLPRWVLAVMLGCVTSLGLGSEATAKRAVAPAKPAAKPAAAPPATAAPAPAPATPAPTPPATAGNTPPQPGADAPAPSRDDEVTRYTFTGLDIDGELRTPALLQFLARIGGEFETVGIPHRSFMPELSFTVTEDAL